MFNGASSFNQDLGDWAVHSVTDMAYMFSNAYSFDQDLSDWRVDSVTSIFRMFSSASAFDQDLGWCVDDSVILRYAFDGALCASTSCGILSASTLQCGGGPMSDSTIKTAVAAWLSDATAAEAKYGHISTWETGEVTDMSRLFAYESSFNDDIGAWDTSSVVDMNRMFLDASAFNQPMGGWRVDKVKDMYGMLSGAVAFDQDLGWCVDKAILSSSTFEGTKCKSTRCGVKREAFGTCDEGAIAGYSILTALSCLLFLLAAFLAAYVRCKKKKDETYAAAARRLLTSWKKEAETYVAAARRVLCRRGTKVRATTTPDEAVEQSRDEPALPASMVSVVEAPAGIAQNELGTVVSVKH